MAAERNMEGVRGLLEKALEILESDVPYSSQGEYPGELEVFLLRELIVGAQEEAERLRDEFGL